MKGSIKNLFVIIMILISLIGSSIQARPVDALAYPGTNIPMSPPTTWQTARLMDVWGYDANNIYIAGHGTVSSSTRPVIYNKNGSAWDPSTPGLPTAPGTWSSGSLKGVWGADTSNVYAVGSGTGQISGINYTLPLIYKKNGTTWDPTSPDLPGEIDAGGWISGILEDAWGSSADNVYAVGYGSTFGAPTKPIVYRSTDQGLNWNSSQPPLLPSWNGYLYGIWGSAANDVYVVGYGNEGTTTVPLIYHTSDNGANWIQTSLSLPTGWDNGSLYAIWGSAANDIYAVGSGNNGTTTVPLGYHYNGSSWVLLDPLPLIPSGWGIATLTNVWGSDGIVYAAGYGTNGDTVTPVMYSKTSSGWAATIPAMGGWDSRYIESIWGSDAFNVYIVGYGDTPTDNDQPLLYSVGQDTTAPGAVTAFTASPGRFNGTVRLRWTAPADDAGNPDSGPVDSYTVIRSTANNLTSCDDADGTPITSGLPVPTAPGTTQYMFLSGLTPGTTYYFAVCAWDEADPVSDRSAHVVASAVANVGDLPPEATTLVAPSGSITTNEPTYTWNADYYSSWYYLWVNGPSGNVIKTWYTAADAGCSSGIGTCSVTPSKVLASGTHTWWVRSWNFAGLSPWSAPMNFTAPVPTVPPATTLVSPSGSIADYNPTYIWNKVTASTWYQLSVSGPSGYAFTKWYKSVDVCGASTCSVAGATPNLAVGAFTWKVQTWNSVGVGPWSATLNFSTPAPAPPGAATLVSPTGSIDTGNPTYIWNKVTASTWYQLSVSGPSGYAFTKWYKSVDVCGASTCSVAGATPSLVGGTYTWKVQTWNSVGVGPWSAELSFTVTLPGPATLVSPNGTTADHTPIYTWNDVSDSTWYQLQVNGPSGVVIKKWYTETEAHCDGSTCWVEPTTMLASGDHTWWIQTWNPSGAGPWSTAMNFTVNP